LNKPPRKPSIDRLSNMPVGTACESVASDSIMPRRKRIAAAPASPREAASHGTSAARARNSENAGRRKISGRQRGVGALADEQAIHLRGEMPFASAAATKLPDETPT
jgi:hypothetical protein